MKFVASPYRWTWRYGWMNLARWPSNVINGIRNLYVFFEAVWWFRSWDWTGMVGLLRVAANEMKGAQDVGRHTCSARDAKRLLIVRELCRRMLEDEYSEGFNRHDEYRYRHMDYLKEQDAAYLAKTMRYLQHWWA